MANQHASKHDWIYEVFLDISKYAQKNGMPRLLKQIEVSLEALEPEIGSSGKLPELRIFFETMQKEHLRGAGGRLIMTAEIEDQPRLYGKEIVIDSTQLGGHHTAASPSKRGCVVMFPRTFIRRE